MVPDRLHIGNSVEHHYLCPEHILYIKSDGNYSIAYLLDGSIKKDIPRQLGQIAQLISKMYQRRHEKPFVQVGRYYIVNCDHIESIYLSKKQLLFDIDDKCSNQRVAISPSIESLHMLIDLLEQNAFSPLSDTYLSEESDTMYNDSLSSDDSIKVLG